MNWQATLILFSSTIIAGAQTPAARPLPDVATLVQQTIAQQRIAESREREYVFREDINSNKLNKDCTWGASCLADITSMPPKLVLKSYTVLHYSERHFEIFWLDGIRVARVLPPCNRCELRAVKSGDWTKDIPISESELAAENQRVEGEVAEARTLRAQGKEVSSPDDPPQVLLSRMLELCTFSNPRRKVIEGRSTILLDLATSSAAKFADINETALKSFTGMVAIDEEDRAVQGLQGRLLDDVKLPEGNIKIHKGSWISLTNAQVDKGIWLLSHLHAWGEGHYFSFTMDGEVNVFAGNYRKFRTSITILPGAEVLPTKPH